VFITKDTVTNIFLILILISLILDEKEKSFQGLYHISATHDTILFSPRIKFVWKIFGPTGTMDVIYFIYFHHKIFPFARCYLVITNLPTASSTSSSSSTPMQVAS